MKILVDMDGVIADLEGGFLKIWRAQYPDKPLIPIEERTTFYMADQYPEDVRDLIHQIQITPSLFSNSRTNRRQPKSTK